MKDCGWPLVCCTKRDWKQRQTDRQTNEVIVKRLFVLYKSSSRLHASRKQVLMLASKQKIWFGGLVSMKVIVAGKFLKQIPYGKVVVGAAVVVVGGSARTKTHQ